MASSKKTSPRKSSSKNKTAQKAAAPVRPASASDLVDEQLQRYRSMRDFSLTEEPNGASRDKKLEALPFCVQKHAASHLHYDFRLGWNGVLKSWAVAKGPSSFTGDKRLAIQVEDHPLDYGGFEGTIPKGQYGGGTVMLWDQGTWEPQAEYPDVDTGLRDGSLKFILHGTRLKGKWALIRMKGKWARESKPNWLLIKEHDPFEQTQDDEPITETAQTSVVTERTMEEIARSEDHVWHSSKTNSGGQAWQRNETAESAASDLDLQLNSLPEERQPEFIPPELATMTEVPPSAKGWLHELKLDGYRIQARKSGSKVAMLTRTGLDWTSRMKAVAKEISHLPVKDITLDGELVVLAPDGTTSFADLQASMQEDAKHALSYFAFDLLHLNGRNTRDLPLRKRKEILHGIVGSEKHQILQFSEHLETGGVELLKQACKLKAEGIVSKRGDSPYAQGRSKDWIKAKCLHEQEFVVGGYTLPINDIHGVGALLLGYYRDGTLVYAGRTGTGFTRKTHAMLRDKLEELRQTTSSFQSVPAEARKGAVWVKPQLVAQVRFATWTADDLVRQAAFLGLREDKSAVEVVREEVSIGPRRSRIVKSDMENTAKSSKQQRKGEEIVTAAPVRLTHADKVLDSDSGTTKQMLADYYWATAKYMLPEISNRPVSLVRCPDGIGKPSFFQKHANATLPKSVGSVKVPDKKTGVLEKYITVNTAEALAELAQISVMEIHPWGSTNDDLEHPNRLIFDLDPDESLEWSYIVEAAESVRQKLKDSGLKSFVKTTGGKGLHIVAPILAKLGWSEIKDFAHQLVLDIEKSDTERYLTKMSKSARKGRIYLDYLRNERGATAVAAYSPRARKGVPVSLPLSWEELHRSSERPEFRLVDFTSWKDRLHHDPWDEMRSLQQSIG